MKISLETKHRLGLDVFVIHNNIPRSGMIEYIRPRIFMDVNVEVPDHHEEGMDEVVGEIPYDCYEDTTDYVVSLNIERGYKSEYVDVKSDDIFTSEQELADSIVERLKDKSV